MTGACFRIPEAGQVDVFRYFRGYAVVIEQSLDSILRWWGRYHDWEQGFLLLIKFIGEILGHTDITIFMSVFAVLILFPVSYFLWETCEYPIFSMALYIAAGGIMSALSGFRQQCAMVILLLSYKYIEKNNFLVSSIIIVIASFFHRSALVMFVFYGFYYFIKRYEITTKMILVSLLLGIILYANLTLFYQYIVPYLRIQYVLKEATNYGHIAVLWATLFFSLLFDKEIHTNETKKFYYLMLLFSAIMQIAVLGGSQLSRINKYFIFPLCIVLPHAMHSFLGLYERRSKFFPVIVLDILLVFLFAVTFAASYGKYYDFNFN